ncbi:hypothetical protein GNI_045700 [Gregarina niphandrodes]|uniref:Uncharacterized protein n=1 Tax=Gregarina niphandrodes TaxID=110365 RepID=A0A023B9Z3_GRENI|nr:hypothetical protein GNI_045700 [Gregarina niphandrodes]EZG76060.1 hypothetical protein GNI_045700 [Gregarina niphandrodes]|eukprot:XP_011129594.1 hypothetical protein GNI_045700 [Gregarina niphandrodes]
MRVMAGQTLGRQLRASGRVVASRRREPRWSYLVLAISDAIKTTTGDTFCGNAVKPTETKAIATSTTTAAKTAVKTAAVKTAAVKTASLTALGSTVVLPPSSTVVLPASSTMVLPPSSAGSTYQCPTPSPSTPSVSTPSPSTPSPSTPSVSTPSVSTPSVSTPFVIHQAWKWSGQELDDCVAYWWVGKELVQRVPGWWLGRTSVEREARWVGSYWLALDEEEFGVLGIRPRLPDCLRTGYDPRLWTEIGPVDSHATDSRNRALYIPTRPAPTTFCSTNTPFEIYRAIHNTLPDFLWKRLRTIGPEDFKMCGSHLLTLADILTYYVRAPFGKIDEYVSTQICPEFCRPHQTQPDQTGPDQSGPRRLEVWVTACLLQYALNGLYDDDPDDDEAFAIQQLMYALDEKEDEDPLESMATRLYKNILGRTIEFCASILGCNLVDRISADLGIRQKTLKKLPTTLLTVTQYAKMRPESIKTNPSLNRSTTLSGNITRQTEPNLTLDTEQPPAKKRRNAKTRMGTAQTETTQTETTQTGNRKALQPSTTTKPMLKVCSDIFLKTKKLEEPTWSDSIWMDDSTLWSSAIETTWTSSGTTTWSQTPSEKNPEQNRTLPPSAPEWAGPTEPEWAEPEWAGPEWTAPESPPKPAGYPAGEGSAWIYSGDYADQP